MVSKRLNYVGYLHSPEMVHDERVAVVCAFHELVFGLSGDLDYLGPSADLYAVRHPRRPLPLLRW